MGEVVEVMHLEMLELFFDQLSLDEADFQWYCIKKAIGC